MKDYLAGYSEIDFFGLLKNAQMQGPRNHEAQALINNAYLKWYAATTKDEGNAANGRFSAAC
jgi:hypothetical protein